MDTDIPLVGVNVRGPMRQLTMITMCLVALTACERSDADKGIGTWFFRIDTIRSDLDGKTRYATELQIFGKEGPEGRPRDRVAGFRIACSRSGVSAVLTTDQSLESGFNQLRIRLDSQPAYVTEGYSGDYARGGMILIQPLDPLLDSLRGRRRVLIEYGDGVGRTVAEFAVGGFDTLRPPFLTACAGR